MAAGNISGSTNIRAEHVYIHSNNRAYLSTAYNGLVVCNITNPTQSLSSIGSSTQDLYYTLASVVKGNYVYVLNYRDNSALSHIVTFDITSSDTPNHISTVSFGNGSDNTYYVSCTAIDVSGNYLYCATNANNVFSNYYPNTINTPAILVYDISEPRIPQLVYQYTNYTSECPHNLQIQGNYLYTVTYPPIASGLQSSLYVYDISSPPTITQVGQFLLESTFYPNKNGLAVSESYVYVTNTKYPAQHFQVFDVSNKASIQRITIVSGGLVSAVRYAADVITTSEFNSVIVGKSTSADNIAMVIYDISNINNIVTSSLIAGTSRFGNQPIDLCTSGSFLYMVDNS